MGMGPIPPPTDVLGDCDVCGEPLARYTGHAACQVESLNAENDRYVAALKSIANHGMINDNDASMVWTARVALNEVWLSSVPEHLRDVVAARFEEDS